MKIFKALFFSILLIIPSIASEITFTFANAILTGSAPNYYFDFDVMVHSKVDTHHLGDAMIYINYSTIGFGSSIVSQGGITVEKGTLLEGELIPGSGLYLYSIVNVIDNSASRFAITTGYEYSSTPDYANFVPIIPTQLVHIRMSIVDSTVWSDLSFQHSLMRGQQYYSTNAPDDTFDVVIADDILNLPLKYNPSAIATDIFSVMPSSYKLNQNHPNPFNPVTNLTVEIPYNNKPVEIDVFNITGQKVASVFSGTLSSGIHTFTWNGKNSMGQLLPSGIYFAVMRSEMVTQTVKMTLLK
ncbi:MAG: T9SS type A sorting domain-containing protein [Calditrichaceae bacterium]|nr:T9SS type A sorting domain-containing protein [Calditrichaceae bacterium]MBN2710516.1 T9SS type A sorting domain-containing protein [Calditrichaceae bacterium]RQV97308.1 MAG: T9SS C-terminal target domain-containing protein [Calditrichota bacterium]